MYTYVSALGKSKQKGSRWEKISIEQMPLQQVFDQYQSIYVILNNSVLGTELGFDLNTLRTTHYYSALTIEQYLTNLGNKALVTMAKIPTLKTRYARYADAVHAGYKVTPIHRTASILSTLPKSEKTWAHLQRPDTDYAHFFKSCLVTVNGFFHTIDYDTSGIYVLDATTSLLKANHNQIGVYSFADVGTLEHIPIRSEMVRPQSDGVPLKTRAYIDLGRPIGNKTPLLVLGGYLHVLDERTYRMVNDSTLCVEFLNFPLLERFFDSRQYLNLSSLPIEYGSRNESQIALESFFSDETIRAYLTLSQSFVVLLDATDVFVKRIGVDVSPMPGMFTTQLTPHYPLVVSQGRVADYWYTLEDRHYSLTCVDSRLHNRVFRTTDADQLLSVADSLIPTDRIRQTHAHFLQIGIDLAL